MHPKASKFIRRDQRKKVRANRRKYDAARLDTGVSQFEAQVLRQMNAERQEAEKSPISSAKHGI